MWLAATSAWAAAASLPRLDGALTEPFRLVQDARYAEALRAVDAYLAGATPAHAGQAHFVAGLAFHRRQLYGPARERFARAVALEPEYVTAYFFYGFTLLNLGQLDEARAALERYLEADPQATEAHFGLGLVALEQDRGADAERALRRAVELAERAAAQTPGRAALLRDLARYQARLADVYLRRDDLTQARTALEASVRLAADLPEPWHKLALVLRRQGDLAGAARAEAGFAEATRRRAQTRGTQP